MAGRKLTTQGVVAALRKAGWLSWRQDSRGFRVDRLNDAVRVMVSGIDDGKTLGRLIRYAEALRAAEYDAAVMGFVVIVRGVL